MEIIIGAVVVIFIFILLKAKSFTPNYKYKNNIVNGLNEAGLIHQARNLNTILTNDNEISQDIWLSINESRSDDLSVEEAYQKIDTILLKNGL